MTLDSYIDIVAIYCPSIKYLVAVDGLVIFPSDGECFALEFILIASKSFSQCFSIYAKIVFYFLITFCKIDRNLDLFHDLGSDQWPVA